MSSSFGCCVRSRPAERASKHCSVELDDVGLKGKKGARKACKRADFGQNHERNDVDKPLCVVTPLMIFMLGYFPAVG